MKLIKEEIRITEKNLLIITNQPFKLFSILPSPFILDVTDDQFEKQTYRDGLMKQEFSISFYSSNEGLEMLSFLKEKGIEEPRFYLYCNEEPRFDPLWFKPLEFTIDCNNDFSYKCRLDVSIEKSNYRKFKNFLLESRKLGFRFFYRYFNDDVFYKRYVIM